MDFRDLVKHLVVQITLLREQHKLPQRLLLEHLFKYFDIAGAITPQGKFSLEYFNELHWVRTLVKCLIELFFKLCVVVDVTV